MPTTIQVSNNVKEVLERMRLFDKESYNNIIERMIEDNLELNEKTKKEIELRRREKSLPHDKVKEILGL